MSTNSPSSISTQAPWHFRLAKWLIRRGIRGPGIWLRTAFCAGLLHQVVRYQLTPSLTADIPLYRWENLWDREEVLDYERALLDAVAAWVERQAERCTLVDCGADVGLFSILLFMRTHLIDEIHAFEPNPQAFALLEQNLARLPRSARAHPRALSNFQGPGGMCQPAYDRSQHAAFLTEKADGPIEVTTIDRLQLPGKMTLLLKVDVEGGEYNLLRGATETLRRIRRFLIVLEAHPQVIRRTQIDPLDCLRLVQAARDCRVRVAELPELRLDLDRPLAPQLPAKQACNLLIESL